MFGNTAQNPRFSASGKCTQSQVSLSAFRFGRMQEPVLRVLARVPRPQLNSQSSLGQILKFQKAESCKRVASRTGLCRFRIIDSGSRIRNAGQRAPQDSKVVTVEIAKVIMEMTLAIILEDSS